MDREYIEKIKNCGDMIAIGDSNWDFYVYNNIVWSIPKENSGAGHSVWCSVKNLRAHLYNLRHICGRDSLIPPDWEIVKPSFFSDLGIA